MTSSPFAFCRLVLVVAPAVALLGLLAPGAARSSSPVPALVPDSSSRAGDGGEHTLAAVKLASFAKPAIYGTGGEYATSVAMGDLNGDGKADFAVANFCSIVNKDEGACDTGGGVSILIGNGDGTMQTAVAYSSGGTAAAAVAIADVNGDGRADVVVVNECISATDCTSGDVGVLFGNGDGTFQAPVMYTAGYGADAVAIADLNGDGNPDLVIADECVSSSSCNNGGVSILLNKGNGTFDAAETSSSGGNNAVGIAVDDLNNDGFADVVVVNQCVSKSNCNTGGVSVLLGNGNGTLKSPVNYSSGGYSALAVAVADLNGDGRPDIVATNLCSSAANCVDGVAAVLMGNGNGTFEAAVSYSTNGYGASSVAIGDVNGDGFPDLAIDNICKTSSSCAKGGIAVLPGAGDGTFEAPLLYSSDGNDASSVGMVDLNGDSKLDIVTANSCASKSDCDGVVAVLLNDSSLKTTTTVRSGANPSTVGQAVQFTATVSSAAEVPDGESVTFYDGSVALGTSATTDGMASLTTSFDKTGTFTIKASYAGDAYHKASSGKVKQVVN